jgi:hypothetical protein
MLKNNNSHKLNGPQLKLNKILPLTQTVTEPTVSKELTAKSQHALVPMDHLMAQLELHALEKSQLLSHTITPTQLPEDHTLPAVTSPTKPHPHLLQLQTQSFFNSLKNQQQHQPRPQFQHQRKFPSLTQRLPRHTLLSTDNTENEY